ncbi:hypothetical protein EBBID32_43700 [Sphingobium indicum BiD32]|uniref:Bacterial mobilisation domain-containing protein n=1 Tax=Sphingobium indicum BiD32 TaxID=1301087 RepID=N1MTA8_9SPHN|nr:plasmid mobilization relaxosome protein MobC [Sphingobium indicum]CCW19999.1 hypothetical protein EBBID32_43700 [Sphingobium indicum BiD32]
MTDETGPRPNKPDQGTSARRKSEKRQRVRQVKTRMTEAEHAVFLARADKAGMTSAAFLRAAAIGDAGPRAQKRVPADASVLRQVLGHIGKTGSNLNQISRYLHTGGEAQTVLPDIREALADLARIRGLIYDALGKEPDAAAPVLPSPPPSPPES